MASRSGGGEAIKEEDEGTPVDCGRIAVKEEDEGTPVDRSPGAVKEEEVKNIGVDGIEDEVLDDGTETDSRIRDPDWTLSTASNTESDSTESSYSVVSDHDT